MARDEYQSALSALREDVRALGDDALDQLDNGLTALAEPDQGLAEQVIAGDDDLNDRYLELEGDCIDLFALQQPVASDLRFVATSFKILTDVERVGDLATNFGRYALATDRTGSTEVDAYDIGAEVHAQFAAALDAYASSDADACRAIAARDDEVDALCQRASEQVVRDLIEGERADAAGTNPPTDATRTDAPPDDAWAVERVLDDVSRVLLTVRDLERVGDHAVNVAARTLYMVENDPELIR